MHVYRTKDFWAGAIYVAFGVTTHVLGRDYSMGTAARMGPGYFPAVLSGLLVMVGLIAIARGFLRGGDPVPRLYVRPALLVIGSTAFFAATLELLGVALALPGALILSAAASSAFRLKPVSIAGAAVFTIACLAIFIRGLGVPMPMFGTIFGG